MRIAVTVVSALIALPAVAADWEKRLDAFQTKTNAERQKLGLDKLSYVQQRERFPTPEVHFGGSTTTPIVLCPGEARQVTLEGTLPPGSIVVPTTDEVQVSQEKATPGRWSGTLTAQKGTPPKEFNLRAAIALSNQTTDVYGLIIGCKTTLNLTVDGATLTIKADVRESPLDVSGEWKKGGKTLGTTQYELTLEQDGFQLRAKGNEAETERRANIMIAAMQSPKSAAFNERQAKILEKIQACSSQDIAKMMACMKGPQAEADKLNAEHEEYMAEVQLQAAPLFGCDELDVALSNSSTARVCAGHRMEDQVELKYAATSP